MGKLKYNKKNPTIEDHEKRSPQGLVYTTKLHGGGIETTYTKSYIILQHIATKQRSKENNTTQTGNKSPQKMHQEAYCPAKAKIKHARKTTK